MVPQCIVPNPNHKREIMQPEYSEFNKTLSTKNDLLNQFEKEPFKMMLLEE